MPRSVFKPGQPKPAGSGRKKGTPNKNTQLLVDKAQELGCDPFEVLCLFAKGDWKALGYRDEIVTRPTQYGEVWEYTISPECRKSAASDLCQYVYPKRKAVELSTPDSESVTITVKPFDLEERKRQLKGEK